MCVCVCVCVVYSSLYYQFLSTSIRVLREVQGFYSCEEHDMGGDDHFHSFIHHTLVLEM
jgi:hypothetical protein